MVLLHVLTQSKCVSNGASSMQSIATGPRIASWIWEDKSLVIYILWNLIIIFVRLAFAEQEVPQTCPDHNRCYDSHRGQREQWPPPTPWMPVLEWIFYIAHLREQIESPHRRHAWTCWVQWVIISCNIPVKRTHKADVVLEKLHVQQLQISATWEEKSEEEILKCFILYLWNVHVTGCSHCSLTLLHPTSWSSSRRALPRRL